MWTLVWTLLLLNWLAAPIAASCPEECECNGDWVHCELRGLTHIPENFDYTAINVVFSQNNLYNITDHAFESTGLVNLQWLGLDNCNLVTIEKNGFSGLDILFHLGLSYNRLKTLHIDTFQNTLSLVEIDLKYNEIEKLEEGLFRNLKYLLHLRLNGNKIKNLNVNVFSTLTSLSELFLFDNPWQCDCNLRSFRDWAVLQYFAKMSDTIECAEPLKVQGKTWGNLTSSELACVPNSVHITSSSAITTLSHSNITLSCQAGGDPLPEIKWFLNYTSIEASDPNQGQSKYKLTETIIGSNKWANLTIFDANPTDKGNYTCVAENSAGKVLVERSLVFFNTAQRQPETEKDVQTNERVQTVIVVTTENSVALLETNNKPEIEEVPPGKEEENTQNGCNQKYQLLDILFRRVKSINIEIKF